MQKPIKHDAKTNKNSTEKMNIRDCGLINLILWDDIDNGSKIFVS